MKENTVPGEINKVADEETGMVEGSDSTPKAGASPEQALPGDRESPAPEQIVPPFRLWLKFARRPDVWGRILRKVAVNPVIWGIAAGFFLSLTTIGPKYLNPNSQDFVPGLGWLFTLATWFGDMVSPLSLFAMGVWMENQGRQLFSRIPLYAAILSMFSKLVLVPLVMVGLAKACKLSDEAGRAAVLIAALPISMASFTLGSQYKIGEALISENVALGTALMLPTVLIWNLVMDEIGLFPI